MNKIFRRNTPIPFGSDPSLAPFASRIAARKQRVEELLAKLTGNVITAADFATGHEYFGLHRTRGKWIFREWAPNATAITLVGDFSDWQVRDEYRLQELAHGVKELEIPAGKLRHGMHYAMLVEWPGGSGLRIPAYTRKVSQDPETKLFTAMVWDPETPYVFKNPSPPRPEAALIYEAHPGMALEEEKIGSFREFREQILPKVVAGGYNTLQLMAVVNHPYYASFGYHVANFFAVSDRFGTPEEFKELVDCAHGMGLRVIIDLVHSHAVRNEAEGLARIDGKLETYFREGARGIHPTWDSLCFDYGKIEVLQLLLSNCRFFLDEYHVDGFRFDGITSMLYRDHGLNRAFGNMEEYFDGGVDEEALTYLTLANMVIHEVRPDAYTIAEDVSGMPGLASPVKEGGAGFDCRLAMGVTDYWFKLLDLRDEEWDLFQLYHELTNHRRDEHTVSYAECHDQALVGGRTLLFTMTGAEIYFAMHRNSNNAVINRAVALHKMIRLATAATGDAGYLNFMGNEFGHPEWIDFPREGNNWSFKHARRQWSLSEDDGLRFKYLLAFDRAMLKLVGSSGFYEAAPQCVRIDREAKILIFERGGWWFLFNFNSASSYAGYTFEALPGEYELVLSTDNREFDGFGNVAFPQRFWTIRRPEGTKLSVYLPSRTALVLKRVER